MYAAVILYVFRNESSAKLYMHLFKKKEGNHSLDFCWTRLGIILNCGLLFFRMRSINGRVNDKIWLLCLHRHFCNFSYCIKYSWIRPINDDYFKYSHFFQFHEKEKDLYSKNSRIVILVQLKGVFLHPAASLHGFIAVSARCLFSLHAGFTA